VVRARLSEGDAAFFADRLRLVALPYSYDELEQITAELLAKIKAANWGVGWGLGRSCERGAIRLSLELYSDCTPRVVDEATAFLAQYGDRAVLSLREYGPSQPTALPSDGLRARGVRGYVIAPATSRCLRDGHVRVKLRAGTATVVDSVAIRAHGRTQVLTSGARHRTLAVKVGRRSTSLRISLRLRDGRRVTQTLTYRRCG